MHLFSRPVRPAAGARRRRLTLTRLETRDCPAAPVIDLAATNLGGDVVQITGTVLDENPDQCLINLGGVTAPIALVNPDGTFEIVTTLPGGGLVSAFAVDAEGMSSEHRAVPATNAPPSIVEFGVENQGGSFVISGRVVDERPDQCTVELTSSIPALNGVILHPSEGGYWHVVWTPTTYIKNGSIRAIASDDMCQQSTPVDGWVG